MADITALKNRIRAAIKANDNQEITGPVLQQALLDIADELNDGTEAETSRAEGAESTLQQNITAEKNRAEGAESTLQQNITAEKTRAEDAESTLQQNITAEKNRAEGAESTLQQNITAEKTRAEDAESTLQQSITAEKNRAEGAESTLQQGKQDVIEDLDEIRAGAEAGAESLSGFTIAKQSGQTSVRLAGISSEGYTQLYLEGNDDISFTPADNNTVVVELGNNAARSSAIGYFICDTAVATAAKTVSSSNYVLSVGGSIKIKMTNANTAASDVTLKIGSAEAKPLYYAGQAVSASNTWQAGETVEVYYDGTNYQANNVAGGGGSGDGVYDISEVHSGTAYANLAAALGANGANVPSNVRKGGMSVKFVNTSGKYEKWRYMGTSVLDAYFGVVTNWQGVDDEPTAGSNNLVKSGGVAEKFNNLSENVYYRIGGELNSLLYLEQGSIKSGNGTDESANNRIRTNNFIKADTVNIATSGNKVYVFGYKDDGTFVSATGWITTSQSVKITNATKYRFAFAFSDDAIITPSQFDSLDISIIESFNGYFAEKAEVDSEISQIMSSIVGRNYQLISGGGIKKTDGRYVPGSTYRTDFIKIEDGCDIFVKALTASSVTALALYSTNNDNGFISAEQTDSIVYKSAKQLSDAGAKYFKCSIDASQVANNTWFICHAPIKTLINEITDLTQRIDSLSSPNTERIKNIAESLGNDLSPIDIECDTNGYELPTTKQTLASQKKIEQLTQIKWTPLNAVPYNNGLYPANVEKTGLPYSSVKEYDKFIGFDVSVYTFMTAINNPYSLVYTENVGANTSASAWGKTYHGTNSACYYGLVCNVFALQCNGVNIPWNTYEHKWSSQKMFNLIKIYNQSAQGLQIGDIFWQSGHDMIIYKIKRNSDGNVTHVTIAEALGLAHVMNEITAEEFDSMLSTRIIYRSLERYKNKYTPSPFVAIRDEVITPYEYNDDICCFAGDKATFREGDTIAIDYNLKNIGTWTAMELYKNDTLLNTIIIDNTKHWINLTSRNLTYGTYKARMTDGENYSDYTEFEIIQTNVSIITTGNYSKINFSSSNGSPIYIRICNLAGETYGMYKLTDDDISNGYCIMNFTELNSQQYPSKPLSGTIYVKVYFEGNFGRVTNQLITL